MVSPVGLINLNILLTLCAPGTFKMSVRLDAPERSLRMLERFPHFFILLYRDILILKIFRKGKKNIQKSQKDTKKLNNVKM